MKILVTCPPMLRMIDSFRPLFEEKNIELTCPEVVQTLSVDELKKIVPLHDGWIIGDDPATSEVFEEGKKGCLKAAVKWGIGVDNVDFSACKELQIPISNTPDMFGGEVADIAIGYLIGLARETFLIDRCVRNGEWVKPSGISLAGKTVALIGFGDIGRNIAKRLLASDMRVIAYDPGYKARPEFDSVERANWPDRIEQADFIIAACALTTSSHHMINEDVLAKCKNGVRIVNVARGPIIDENALLDAIESGKVHSVALDVFEIEPLPIESPLRNHERCIFGSHNASNTVDAVERTSVIAIEKLFGYLNIT